MNYLRNCWYMVGWGRDFSQDAIVPFTLLNEPVIIYRKSDGALVALQDRCCHRLAPLSLGQKENDDIRCMYHGLKFAPDGRCVEIPGQDRTPPAKVCVRSFPIVERHSAAWIWMGDAALVDEALIPDFIGVDHPDWAMVPGRMDYKAAYNLINDNLLDLSHLSYVHKSEESFAAENQWANSRTHIARLERGVRVSRWIENVRQAPTIGGDVELTDRWSWYDFLVPGVFLLHGDTYPAGTAARFGGQAPEGEPLRRSFSCQAVTPLTDKTACYFFAFGPSSKEAQKKEMFYKMGHKAFDEDRNIIEAQQRTIDASPGVSMLPLAMDTAVNQYYRIFDALVAAEQQAASSSTAADSTIPALGSR